MCGRFAMEEMLNDMVAEFGLKGLPNRELSFDWNIKPTQVIYIVKAHRTFKPRIRARRLQAIASTVPPLARFSAISSRGRSSESSQHRFNERFPVSNTAFPNSGRTHSHRRPLRSREVPQRQSVSLTETRTSTDPAVLAADLAPPSRSRAPLACVVRRG